MGALGPGKEHCFLCLGGGGSRGTAGDIVSQEQHLSQGLQLNSFFSGREPCRKEGHRTGRGDHVQMSRDTAKYEGSGEAHMDGHHPWAEGLLGAELGEVGHVRS